MLWRLRLSEFTFEVKYKKGQLNCQADALSRLRTLGETVESIYDEISCFLAEASDDKASQEPSMDLGDVLYDEHLATRDEAVNADLLAPIALEELLTAQLADKFCATIRSRLNGGRCCHFRLMRTESSFALWIDSLKP